jgi:hypothetical protein
LITGLLKIDESFLPEQAYLPDNALLSGPMVFQYVFLN